MDLVKQYKLVLRYKYIDEKITIMGTGIIRKEKFFIRRNDLPTGGESKINPSTGNSLATNFTISTNGWNDQLTS